MADGPYIDLIVPRFEEITPFYQAADRMGFHSLWFTELLFSHGSAMSISHGSAWGNDVWILPRLWLPPPPQRRASGWELRRSVARALQYRLSPPRWPRLITFPADG